MDITWDTSVFSSRSEVLVSFFFTMVYGMMDVSLDMHKRYIDEAQYRMLHIRIRVMNSVDATHERELLQLNSIFRFKGIWVLFGLTKRIFRGVIF